MNVEIQQRACEYLQFFDKKWDDDRHGIFEPMPVKGDRESKALFGEGQADRPDFDDEQDDGDLGVKTSSQTKTEIGKTETGGMGNLIGIDDLLGGLGTSTTSSKLPST